jgi:hypothetical protein
MTNVLHRRTKTAAVESRLPSAPDFVPPSLYPPDRDDGPRAPWPFGAKVLIAILIIAAVLGTVGTAIGFNSDGDESAERQLQDRIDSLTADRDNALDAVGQLDAELVTLRQRLQDAQAANDGLTDRVIELEDQIESLTVVRDEALSAADGLVAELATVRQRVTAAVAERDVLAKLFPIEVDSSLGDVAVVGKYDIKLSQVYCSGLSSCGKANLLDDPTIRKTADGFLRLDIPRFVEGGLFKADGALHMVADSTSAVPACAGTARASRVVMTILSSGFEIGRDGSADVAGLNAVITAEAPAVGSCPAALAFYTAELAPHA